LEMKLKNKFLTLNYVQRIEEWREISSSELPKGKVR
jgi:hypothetical protein